MERQTPCFAPFLLHGGCETLGVHGVYVNLTLLSGDVGDTASLVGVSSGPQTVLSTEPGCNFPVIPRCLPTTRRALRMIPMVNDIKL